MQNLLSIPMRPIDRKRFLILLIIVSLITIGAFGFTFRRGTAQLTASVAPGRLGAPSFSHYIYGGFGNEALHKPMFATFGNGRVYVSDTNNFRIQVFSEEGQPLFKFGERGNGDGQFFYPYGIVVGPDGNLYIADMYRSDIQVFTPDGEYIRKFAPETGKSIINGPGAMYLSDDGRLFVPNINTYNILVFDLQSEELLQVIGLPGDMFAPNSVTLDGDGYIYVVDTGGQKVIVYSPDGSRPVRLINGSPDGRGASVLMNPRGVGIRGDWIFVASNLTHTIHVFNKEGREMFTFGKQGDRMNEFMHPNGLSVDHRGRMLITDTVGARIAVYR